MTRPFRIEVLSSQHDPTGFCCGVEALDDYLSTRVTQDMRRRVTACYVAVEAATSQLAGFYTLAAADVVLTDLPEAFGKRLPRYPAVPVARLGRLAVDVEFQDRRLGAAMLWDAITRAARSEVAVFALVVDAKDSQAEAFYRHHGFMPFSAEPRRLILPLKNLIAKNFFAPKEKNRE